MDFGCGPGMLSDLLSKTYDVLGSDASTAMIVKARELFPSITFFEWDGLSEPPHDLVRPDIIVTKLTLEFIQDLSTVAKNLRALLNANGSVVVSVQHPIRSIRDRDAASYWDRTPARFQIGQTGLHVDKIPPTFADYVNAFTQHGFVLDYLGEPEIPLEVMQKYNVKPESNLLPKRLILRFSAV